MDYIFQNTFLNLLCKPCSTLLLQKEDLRNNTKCSDVNYLIAVPQLNKEYRHRWKKGKDGHRMNQTLQQISTPWIFDFDLVTQVQNSKAWIVRSWCIYNHLGITMIRNRFLWWRALLLDWTASYWSKYTVMRMQYMIMK